MALSTFNRAPGALLIYFERVGDFFGSAALERQSLVGFQELVRHTQSRLIRFLIFSIVDVRYGIELSLPQCFVALLGSVVVFVLNFWLLAVR